MFRRRLILAACIAAVALGAAWWLLSDRLTAEERQVVGKWRYNDAETGEAKFRIVFTTDRRYYDCDFPDRAPCSWHVQDGSIVFDFEPSPVRRALRPVAHILRLSVGERHSSPIEVAGDVLTIGAKSNLCTVWVRDRGD